MSEFNGVRKTLLQSWHRLQWQILVGENDSDASLLSICVINIC